MTQVFEMATSTPPKFPRANSGPAPDAPPSVALVKASLYTIPPPHQNFIVRVWLELWVSRWLLLSAIGAGLLVGLVYNVWQTPLYQSHASIEVQGQAQTTNLQPSDKRQRSPDQAALDFTGSTLETQVRILESRDMLERALNHLPGNERLRIVASSRFGGTPPDVLQVLAKRLKVTTSTQAHIVDMDFLCPDPQAGADFLNALAQELSDYTLERQWKAAQRSSDWLQPQLNDVRTRLENSEKALDEYARGGDLSAPANGSDLETRWATARSDRIASQVLFDHLRAAPLNQVADMSGDATLKSLQRQADDLQKQPGDGVKLRDVQRSLADRRNDVLSQAKGDYLTALAQEKMLRDQIGPARLATLEAQSKLPPEKTARYALLKQEVDANRQLYETLTTRVTEAGIASGMRTRNILLLDSAYPARYPVSPNFSANAAGGLIAGALAGLLLVLYRKFTSPTFSQPGTLSRVLSLPELGAIPEPQPRMLPGSSMSRIPGDVAPFSAGDNSAQSESYRAIRSSLLYQTGDQLLRCLVFTSASPGEGKTTVVSNLSMSLAATNRRVLIIDGDLRRPKLHKTFGVAPSPGLSDLLRRERLLGLQGNGQFVVETQIPNLFLLPCGTAGGDAPELLAGNRLPALLRELEKSFDLILIDTPPLLPCADARSFSKSADGVVLVVRANETDRRAAGVARDTLLKDGSTVIGTVLTGFHARRGSYGYHGYSTTA
jgi:capsular exopolysaccharide synthesis family protein